jgi:glycosyltransferase involved in cell wall biosynthesis
VLVASVSIGLPVRNGDDYLADAVSSLLNQTFVDLEIVISDNASDDDTDSICRRFTEEHPSVRYFRQEENIGAAPNYNFVFEKSTGEYFAWHAHDDMRAPAFCEKSVAALIDHPDAIGVASVVDRFSTSGSEFLNPPLGITSSDPATRLKSALMGTPSTMIFALFRSSVVRNTALHGGFTGSDRVLVSELALQGPIVILDDPLFLNREHPGRSVRSHNPTKRNLHPREAWFDPSRAGRVVFPNWRRLAELVRAVLRTRLNLRDRIRCLGVLVGWLFTSNARQLKAMVRDVVVAGREIVARTRRKLARS